MAAGPVVRSRNNCTDSFGCFGFASTDREQHPLRVPACLTAAMPPKATRSAHRRHSLEPQALEDVSKREVKKRRSFRSSSEAGEDEHVAVQTKTEITFTSYKEGFLKKRSMNSSLWHSWKVRYFLLIDGGLMYYKTAVDARGQTRRGG